MSSPAQPFRPGVPPRGEQAAASPTASQPVQPTVNPSTMNQAAARAVQTEEQLQALWRARALRYVLIYLLLACVLVTLRYQGREVYPNLRQLSATRTELQREQEELSLRVQTLTSEQRIRAWALENGMVPYAQAGKQTQTFETGISGAAPLPEQAAPTRLVVRTAWK